MADKPSKRRTSKPQLRLRDPDQAGRWALERTDERGKRSRMFLSEEDVVILAQSAARLMDRLLQSRQKPGGPRPVRYTAVEDVSIQADLLGSMLVVTLHHVGGTTSTYGLPMAVARGLALTLPLRLYELAFSSSKKPPN